MKLGVYPDMAVFGKTIANGFAMGAIIGKNRIMKNAAKTFISSAFWTERIGPSCAVAFIKKHKKLNLGNILIGKGKKIKEVWQRCAYKTGLDIEINGIDPLPTFKLNVNDWPATLTYFIQEMLKNKFLATDKCYANYKHDNNLIKKYEKACFKVFQKIYKLDKSNSIKKNLESPVKLMGFKRLTN